MEYMSVGLVTGITHEIFEVRNIRSGTGKNLRTLTRCRGIKWGAQFDIRNMWSAMSPSHWNWRRNSDLAVTSERRCEIIQHSPGNFESFRQHAVHRYDACNVAGGHHFENSCELIENNSIKNYNFFLSTLLGDAVNRQKWRKSTEKE